MPHLHEDKIKFLEQKANEIRQCLICMTTASNIRI